MQRDFKGIWIPKEIWLNKDLKIMEKLFLVEIDSLDSETTHCYASNEYFSQFFDLSKNRCSEIIKSLANKRLIEVEYLYKGDTKEIDKRIIKVLGKSNTPLRNIDTPPSEKCEDNNTILNNINNKYKTIIDKWNSINELSNIVKISDKRDKLIKALLKDFKEDDILKAIDNISNSDFLKGYNNKNWKCTFDWLLNKNNFIKVLEGNYNKKTKPAAADTPKINVNVNDIINNLRGEEI